MGVIVEVLVVVIAVVAACICLRKWSKDNAKAKKGKWLIQSTLVISKSKGPSKTVRDIRTSTYQICSIEEKTI